MSGARFIGGNEDEFISTYPGKPDNMQPRSGLNADGSLFTGGAPEAVVEAFFNAGFKFGFEAVDGARLLGVQATVEGQDVDEWLNQGTVPKNLGSASTDPVYHTSNIDGSASISPPLTGGPLFWHTLMGDDFSRTLFTLLIRVRFDAKVSGTQAFWPRHNAGRVVSCLIYDFATNELLFQNIGVGIHNIIIDVPQDTDLTIYINLVSGTITCAAYQGPDDDLIAVSSVAHTTDDRPDDNFALFCQEATQEINIKKAVWYDSDESADLTRLLAAMRIDGFPTS